MSDKHVLKLNGDDVGTYELIGVLLYKKQTHYITTVYDRTYGWVRYDGYPPANGVGQRVPPPEGRVRHVHGLSGEYYPVDVLYARVAEQ